MNTATRTARFRRAGRVQSPEHYRRTGGLHATDVVVRLVGLYGPARVDDLVAAQHVLNATYTRGVVANALSDLHAAGRVRRTAQGWVGVP